MEDYFEKMKKVWQEFSNAVEKKDIKLLKELVTNQEKMETISNLPKLFWDIKEMDKGDTPSVIYDAIVEHGYKRLSDESCPSCGAQMKSAYAGYEMFEGVPSVCPQCKKLFICGKGSGPDEAEYKEGEKPEDFIWTKEQFRAHFFENS
ncbi:MAG: hypothetical protein WC614_07000 [bacterium]